MSRFGVIVADPPWHEGDDVKVHAVLSDVDEVALVVRIGWVEDDDSAGEVITVHMDRVHAIALAGQLAGAATVEITSLPRGHVNG